MVRQVAGQGLSLLRSPIAAPPPGAHRVPQRHLPLTHAAEARGQDLSIGYKDCAHRPGPLMGTVLLLQEKAGGQSSAHTNILSTRLQLRAREGSIRGPG